MQGHAVLDGVEYLCPGQSNPTRSNANELAAKLGSGAGEYDDLLSFNAWLMDSWEAGIGKKDPEAGGSLISTLDTRFKQQFALPPITRQAPTDTSILGEPYSDNYLSILGTETHPYATVTISPTATGLNGIHKLANQFRNDDSAGPIDCFEVLLPGKSDSCQNVYVELWQGYDPDGELYPPGIDDPDYHQPSEMLQQCLIELRDEPGWYWYAATGLTTDFDGFADPMWYALVVYPAEGDLIIPTVEYQSSSQWYYYDDDDLGTEPTAGWLQEGEDNFQPNSFMHRMQVASTADAIKCVRFGEYIYIAQGEALTIYDETGEDTTTTDMGEVVTDLLALDGRLYIGLGDSVAYEYIDTPGVVSSDTGAENARLLRLIDGRLWIANGSDLKYTADEIEWATVSVGLTGQETIRGFAGLNGEVIVSTNRAIYRVVDADQVLFISEWGAPSDDNGKYMLTFQGNLYISMGESIIRFDGENFLPYGLDLGEGLPARYSGDIVGFAANNNWLLVGIAGPTGTLWAHNGQGWHHITELPVGVSLDTFCYSHEVEGFGSFFSVGDLGTFYLTLVADTNRVMQQAAVVETPDYQYHHYSGWTETLWFYGGLRETQKDWESVYIDGEVVDSNNFIDVYWQANEETAWNYLGRVTEATQELRWSDYDTRPQGRRLRIGLAAYNSFTPGTPVVTAVRVKYQPMVTDRWRWRVPIEVKNNQEMLDRTMNQRNRDVMVQHLDGLTKRVPPFIYQDTDGHQYEVKIMTATRQVMRQSVRQSGEVDIQYIYNLVLEQVTADEYVPQ